MLDLYPYQKTGARWLAGQTQALLADDMGLGKSAQAVHAADLANVRSILVICPAAVRVNWQREFERFSPLDREIAVVKTAKDPVQGPVVIVSYDLAVPLAHILKARQWDLLILDEAHYLKERSAKRTKAIYGHGSNRPGIISRAKRVWRLTGTPAPNDASELYTHLKTMNMINEPYWDFVFRFCTGFNTDYGFRVTGHKNVEQLKALMAPALLRRMKEEVMKELPPLHYQEVTVERTQVELDPAIFPLGPQGEAGLLSELKVADQTLRQALEAVGGGESSTESRLKLLESMAPSMTTLRRYIGMAKLPAVLDIIQDELASGAMDKVVLFGVHQCVVEAARERLAKFGAVTYYGKTPPQLRQKNIDAFMNDPKCRVFVGNIQAAGVGITLTSACEVAFLEQSWVPSDNAQAAMRAHRIGQTRAVRVRVFSLHQSVDEQVQQTLIRKARELTRIF